MGTFSIPSRCCANSAEDTLGRTWSSHKAECRGELSLSATSQQFRSLLYRKHTAIEHRFCICCTNFALFLSCLFGNDRQHRNTYRTLLSCHLSTINRAEHALVEQYQSMTAPRADFFPSNSFRHSSSHPAGASVETRRPSSSTSNVSLTARPGNCPATKDPHAVRPRPTPFVSSRSLARFPTPTRAASGTSSSSSLSDPP
mmetsp:Transcript_206/g.777  ORF Transcript_206/g.777 Transcript_206/m.777 type:complete len:200 (-) Transcript_206:189-788(-)